MRRYLGKTNTINGNSYEVEIWSEPGVSIRQYVSRVEADGGIIEGLECLNIALGSKELPMASPGFVLDYDGEGDKLWENPIRNSRVNASFVVSDAEDHAFFRSLAVPNEGKSAIVIYKNDNLFYVGRIIADGMQYARRPDKNSIYSVSAVDGLNLLNKYRVDYDWFDVNTERLDIFKLIRKSLELTAVPYYYEVLGYESNYMVDASLDFPTGQFDRLNRLEINLSSVITDLEEFTTQLSLEGSKSIYIDCKTAIERLLRLFHSRLIYTNSRFYVYDPIDYAEKAQTISVEYGTDGTQTGKISTLPQYLIGDGDRPCFEAFPIISHQPAVREIKQTYKRQSVNRVIRQFTSNQAITITSPSIGYVAGEDRILRVFSILEWYQPSKLATYKQQFEYVNFRIYIAYSGGYAHYNYQDQTWDYGKSNVPNYDRIRTRIDSATKDKNSGNFILKINFTRDFIPPASGDEVTVDIAVGTLSWRWGPPNIVNNLIFFKGSLATFEVDTAEKAVSVTNNKYNLANDVTMSDIYEEDVIYGYEFGGNTVKGVGTIWNAASSSASNITAGVWAARQLAAYVDAPKLVSASLVDDGDYYPILTPQFDSESYTFNGGTFNAQNETWEFEILKITQDVASITSDELDFVDTADGGGQQSEGVVRLIQETSLLRDSVSNFDESLPTDIMRLSPDTPTTQPTIDTYFNPVVVYDATEDTLEWNVQEMGKVQSLTGGTHNLDVSAELIVCDASSENIIITLPSPSSVKGRKYIFKKISSSHNVQLSGTIDSAPSYSFNSLWESVTIMSDGSEYYAVGRYH